MTDLLGPNISADSDPASQAFNDPEGQEAAVELTLFNPADPNGTIARGRGVAAAFAQLRIDTSGEAPSPIVMPDSHLSIAARNGGYGNDPDSGVRSERVGRLSPLVEEAIEPEWKISQDTRDLGVAFLEEARAALENATSWERPDLNE